MTAHRWLALLLFAPLLAAPAARASGAAERPAPPAREAARMPAPPPQPKKDPPGNGKAPLSAEDAALVRELALLERLDLLRNLELFDRSGEDEAQQPKRQP